MGAAPRPTRRSTPPPPAPVPGVPTRLPGPTRTNPAPPPPVAAPSDRAASGAPVRAPGSHPAAWRRARPRVPPAAPVEADRTAGPRASAKRGPAPSTPTGRGAGPSVRPGPTAARIHPSAPGAAEAISRRNRAVASPRNDHHAAAPASHPAAAIVRHGHGVAIAVAARGSLGGTGRDRSSARRRSVSAVDAGTTGSPRTIDPGSGTTESGSAAIGTTGSGAACRATAPPGSGKRVNDGVTSLSKTSSHSAAGPAPDVASRSAARPRRPGPARRPRRHCSGRHGAAHPRIVSCDVMHLGSKPSTAGADP